MEHSLDLKCIGNARELGGFPVDGKTVKRGLLLRTASLLKTAAYWKRPTALPPLWTFA